MAGVLLWGWDSVNKVWREVIVDSSGRLTIGSVADAEISQDTPESLKHVPHGYYATGPSYLPLKVKSDGTLCLEITSLPKLDDIGDVDVPSPTDQYLLYWDAAASKWKCKALVDADIPAAIARDTEVATAVSDHAAIAAAHHAVFTATEHTAIGNAAPHHAEAHTLASHTTKAHSELTSVGSSDHHVKYTDAEAKAAAVLAGAITDAETKAPTHDAVYDVKVTAEAAQTQAQVAALIATHTAIAAAHHTKYTDAEAVIAAKTVKLDDFTAPDDNADLNASTAKHGLLLKLDNVATNFLNGQGAWAAPAGGGGTAIQDADADTKIQTEESADEDKIRMDVKGVEAFLLSDAGRLTLAKQSYFTARRTTTQSIPQTTWTKIQYNTEDVDIQGEYDPVTNYRFTAVEAGIYIVFISAGLTGPADGTRVILDAYKNGAACLRLCDVQVGGAGSFPPGGTSGIINLAANNYIEAFIYQSGAAINIAADASSNRFSAAKIA